MTQDELKSSSLGEVTYVQLVDQPRAYRAKVVTVRGTVRQVTEQTPAENDIGLESYYRLVVQPSDGTVWPFFVYCLELPEDFAEEQDPAIDVTATGYFFKNLSYRWQDGLGIAPVILAKTVTIGASGADSEAASDRCSIAPVARDSWRETETGDTPQAAAQAIERSRLLALAGWDAERFARFVDDQPVGDEEQSELIELLWRVRSFDAATIDAWSRSSTGIEEAWENPPEHKGEVLRLNGQVIRVERHELSAHDAARLELPAYFTCEIALADRPGRARVITSRVPNNWLESEALNEPASAAAVFVKRIALPEATANRRAD